jgi:hypothetical protein
LEKKGVAQGWPATPLGGPPPWGAFGHPLDRKKKKKKKKGKIDFALKGGRTTYVAYGSPRAKRKNKFWRVWPLGVAQGPTLFFSIF